MFSSTVCIAIRKVAAGCRRSQFIQVQPFFSRKIKGKNKKLFSLFTGREIVGFDRKG
jgi:hypothetical protein